jgi:hypothetical protein
LSDYDLLPILQFIQKYEMTTWLIRRVVSEVHDGHSARVLGKKTEVTGWATEYMYYSAGSRAGKSPIPDPGFRIRD